MDEIAGQEIYTLQERIKELELLNSKYHSILTSIVPDKISGPFICGEIGIRGSDGLPERFLICPTYGLDGFAVYRKEQDYSAPGY